VAVSKGNAKRNDPSAFIRTASKTHNHTFKTKLLQKVLKKIKRLLEKKLLSKSPKSALMETQIPY